MRPGPSSLRVTWTAAGGVSRAASFVIEAVAEGQVPIVAVVTAPVTTAALTELVNGVAYSVTVTAVNAVGRSAPSRAVVSTPTLSEPSEISKLIVAYEPGVLPVAPDGSATGADAVDLVALTPDRAIGEGMRTIEISEPVSEATAERLARELTADPRVKWAEPDRFITSLRARPDVAPDADKTNARPRPAGAQAPGKSPSASLSGQSLLVGQTACSYSSAFEPIARCFADSAYDSYSSLDAEIVWADGYVRSASNAQLVVDVVPYKVITDANWLLYDDTDLEFCFDTNGDGASNTCITPVWAALGQEQSTGIRIWDKVGSSWSQRGTSCSGAITRRLGDHAAIAGASNSWWQLSVPWSCLVGSATGNVRFVTYLEDYLTYGDLAPDSYSGTPINFAAVTPSSPVAPNAPSALAPTVSSGQASIAFSAPSSDGGATITNYQYSLNNGSTWVARNPVSTSSPLVLTGLTNGTTYNLRLRALNSSGPGTASDPVSFIPLPASVSGWPNDPYYTGGGMWGLTGAYGIQVASAWATTKGAPSVVVAVLDTGITAHPDLAGQTVAGYDMIDDPLVANDGDARDSNPADPGDWITAGESATGYFAGCQQDDSSWHGTHVAGTIAAIANNGVGITGIAPGVRVQPVRVLGKCGGYTSDIAAGITWASGGSVPGVPGNATPARVINMSLGGGGSCSTAFQSAINGAVGRGTTVVVAAGNENSNVSTSEPGNCANVIAVAAIGADGKRASFSNYGSGVDIAAPGVGIRSTLDSGTTIPTSATYVEYSGTSMATPHVAGVVALMLSQSPGLTPAVIESRIKDPARVTGFPGGACDGSSSKTCGVGIVNAALLLGSSAGSASPPDAPSNLVVTPGNAQVSVAFTAPSANGSALTNVEYSVDDGASWVARSPASAVSPVVITGLTNGSTYQVRLRAVNAVGTGAASAAALGSPRTTPGAPTGLLATLGDRQVSVAFTAPVSTGGASITNVEYSINGGSSWVTRSPASTSSPVTITGLTNGTTYSVRLRAVNAAGGGPASDAVSAVPRTTPEAPGSIVVTPGAGQASVAFAAPLATGGAAISNYEYSINGGSSWVTRSPASTSSPVTITGLANGTTYSVLLRAVNAAGSGTASSPVSFVPRTVPDAPSGVLASIANAQSLVSWSAPAFNGGSAVTGYVVQAWTAASGGSLIGSGCSTTGVVACTVTGLRNGTTAYITVAAKNAAGTGASTTPRVSVVPRTVPGSPSVSSVSQDNGQTLVSWVAPSSDGGSSITGYTAQAWSAATGGVTIGSPCTTSGTLSCTVTGLTNGVTAYLAVTAANAAGSGTASSRLPVVPRTVPSTPTSVSASSGNAQSVVSWSPPTSNGGAAITGYAVQVWSAASGGAPVGPGCTTTGALSCTVTGLTNGTPAFVSVSARNAAGVGAESSPRVQVTPRTTPSAPLGLLATPGNGQVSVSFTAPTSNGGASVTNVEYSVNGGTTWVARSPASTASPIVISGLTNGTTYAVRLRAVNAAGSGIATSSLSVVPRTVPGAPAGIAATPGNGQITVTLLALTSTGGSAITNVEYSIDDGVTWSAQSPPSTSSPVVITGLVNGTSYPVRVRAVNAAGGGAASASVSVVPRTVPGAPIGLLATPGNGQVSVAFDPPAANGGAAITNLQYSVNGGTTWVARSPASTASPIVISGLTNGTTYQVRLRAVNGAGPGVSSASVSATARP